jgi:membrane protease YdiL (CAAX protease family)
VLVVVVCVGAPLVEELFFRGLLQTRLVGRYGPVIGIGITSMLFGAAHLIGWQGPITLVYALGVAGGGVALGTVRLITGRLGTSILTHCFFNAQALLAIAFVAHNAGR